jgi:hypothetical protein
MPYVTREADVIVSMSRQKTSPSQKWIADDDPELRDFLNKPETPSQALYRGRRDMEFVAEDILHVLLTNGTIGADDLDPGVVGLLASRRALRGKPE